MPVKTPNVLKKTTRTPAASSQRSSALTFLLVPLVLVVVFLFTQRSTTAALFPQSYTTYFSPSSNPDAITVGELSELRRADLENLGLAAATAAANATQPDAATVAALKDLAQCTTLECITDVKSRLGDTKFNFPHFFIAGWQKCATTSVYNHLTRHPEVAKPFVKEPHFFTACQRDGPACKVAGGNSSRAYIRDSLQVERIAASGLTLATMDASVDYAMFGETLAPTLSALFPWLKLVFVLRERIGRAQSWKNMLAEKYDNGCTSKLGKCLLGSLKKMNYSSPLAAWLDHFPSEQIHVMQFEALAVDPEPELHAMKIFLGLDPSQPAAELKNVNPRPGSSGWTMSRIEYQDLIDESRRDAELLVELLTENGLVVGDGGGRTWMKNWETVWQKNLDTCDSDGMCSIASS